MTIVCEIDPKPFLEEVARLGQRFDQVPFALSRTMNIAVENAKRVLVEVTWPSHVTVRNKGFLGASLKTVHSTKQDLTVRIVDVLNKGHLLEHAQGGINRPRAADQLAIPMPGRVRRTSQGIAAGQTPRDYVSMALAQQGRSGTTYKQPTRKQRKGSKTARPSVVTIRITNAGIFKAENGRLVLVYARKPQVQIAHDVPFYEDFNDVIRRDMAVGFSEQMRQAMLTAR